MAGARNTLTSLWKVDDAGTRAMFEAFYGRLWRDRLPLRAALTHARRDLRERGFGPETWAAFVLYTSGPLDG